jgi:hypothetical protein
LYITWQAVIRRGRSGFRQVIALEIVSAALADSGAKIAQNRQLFKWFVLLRAHSALLDLLFIGIL